MTLRFRKHITVSTVCYCQFAIMNEGIGNYSWNNKDQLSLTNPRCITVNVLPTNRADAQCDKLATELSWQRFASKVAKFSVTASAAFNLPHLHLVPAPRWPRLSFAEIFDIRKLESLDYRAAFLRDPTFSRFSRTPTCDRRCSTYTQWQIIPALSVAPVKTNYCSSICSSFS